MLESLLDILASLLGLGDGDGSSPARPPRRAPPGQTPEPPQSRRKTMTLEDVFKQMMGAEEPREPAPPPPMRRERPQARQQPRPPQPAPAKLHPPVPAPVPAPEPARAAQPPAFVASLRANPDAARQAFVYAEIFGPPLADRR